MNRPIIYCYLLCYVLFLHLVSYLLCHPFLILSHRVHIVPFCPKVSLPLFILSFRHVYQLPWTLWRLLYRDTLTYGGIPTNLWMWSGHACASMRSTFSPSIIFLWSFLRPLLLFYLFFFSYSLQQTRYDIGIYLYVRMLRMVSFPSHVETLRIVFYNAAKPHFYPIRRVLYYTKLLALYWYNSYFLAINAKSGCSTFPIRNSHYIYVRLFFNF